MRCWSPSTWLLIACLAGCASLAKPPRDTFDALKNAAAAIETKDYKTAILQLDAFGPKLLSLEDKVRWHLLRGTALFQSGEAWEAYSSFREFINGLSIPAPALADLTFRIGETLAASDASFWPFYSDREYAKQVLRAFVTLYSTRPQMPDALHRLAELAFEDRNYDLARQRYTQLITGRFDRSVWNTKAAFRVAMCYFNQLDGPEYDLESMDRAKVELTDFLKSDVENPSFREQAQVALRTVRGWLGEKHESIANFYRTLENPQGEKHHLLLAVTRFPETEASERAGQRLEALAAAAEAGDDAKLEGPPPRRTDGGPSK